MPSNEALAELYFEGKAYKKILPVDINTPDFDKECELKLATALYDCFTEATGYTAQWGILTGVRPAKLFSRLCNSLGEEKAEDYFKNTLKVNDNKISL